MRALRFDVIIGALFLSSHSLAFSLTQLQPIAGFSDACTQAYESPLTACTISDFYQGATCSAQCVAGLQDMTKLLNDECRGITAFPNTLIGMFFKKTAVEELCPNVAVETLSAAGGTTADATAAPSQISIEITSTTSLITSTTTTSSAASSTSTTSMLSTTTSATLPSSSTTSFEPALIGGTASPSQVNGKASASAATSTSTKQAGSTPVSQGASGGNNISNSGTVLDAASTAGSVSRAGSWLWSISAGLAAAAWFFGQQWPT